jgi:diacylglycerol kinase
MSNQAAKDEIKDLASRVEQMVIGILVAILICLLISLAGNVKAYREERANRKHSTSRVRYLYLAGAVASSLLMIMVILGLISVPMVTSRLNDEVDQLNNRKRDAQTTIGRLMQALGEAKTQQDSGDRFHTELDNAPGGSPP